MPREIASNQRRNVMNEDEKQERMDRRTEEEWLEADRELEIAIRKRVAAGNEMAVLALKRLSNWVPECGFPRNIIPAYCDEITLVTEYRETHDLNSELPFCCEAYTYEVWGKDDARSFLCLLEQLARALGLEGLHDRRLR